MLDYEGLKAAMGELDEDIVMELLKGVMEVGGGEAGKAMDACSEGMNTVGELFQKNGYFVGDLIYAVDALLCRDRLCRRYNKAYRAGKIGAVKK